MPRSPAARNTPANSTRPGLAYGAVVTSTIAKGRIARIDVSEALRVEGVLDILTHEHRPRMAAKAEAYKDDVGPEDGKPFRPLYDDKIVFSGQPIALVVAEEWEIARFAASLVRVEYKKAEVRHRSAGRARQGLHGQKAGKAARQGRQGLRRGRRAPRGGLFHPERIPQSDGIVRLDRDLGRRRQAHGHDKTQGVQNVQRYLCSVFAMKPDDVRVMSPFMGGGFGSGLRPQYQVALAVLAARALERSVRLVLTRQQMYGLGYRPATIEHLALGAKQGGTLDAVIHEAIAATSQYEDFSRNDTAWSGQLYKSPNAKYVHRLARLDLPTPSDMRAPGATTGVYGLECAMDELAVALKLDPLELRLRCYSDRDQNEDKPYTSKKLRECYRQGAASVRLGQAQSGAALDARRQRVGRLGHGDRHLGSAADGDGRPHRADGERPCRGRFRVLRHRHRHLYDHRAGHGRHARPAARQCHREACRLDAAASSGRGRLMDGGLGVACHRQEPPTRSAKSCCGSPRSCRIRRSPPQSSTTPR